MDKSMNEIQKLEHQIYALKAKLAEARKASPGTPVENYRFKTLEGEVSLLELFGGRDTLFLIHNMGQGCRYCTIWGDGLSPFLPHLEDKFAVAMVSKDSPEAQRRFANTRGWRFRMASHGGEGYIRDQSVVPGHDNTPGMVCYVREGNQIRRKNATAFGPGDDFCSIWSVLSLAGQDAETWTPQFSYWRRPEKMDDGGQNLN